jgi:hypothetical protein
MREKEVKSFPGQEKGVIQVLIKHSDEEESIQLRFDFEFKGHTSNN